LRADAKREGDMGAVSDDMLVLVFGSVFGEV
jgi:hypothetical protein